MPYTVGWIQTSVNGSVPLEQDFPSSHLQLLLRVRRPYRGATSVVENVMLGKECGVLPRTYWASQFQVELRTANLEGSGSIKGSLERASMH